MEKYQINFKNKIRANTVTIGYTAVQTALNGQRQILFSGEAVFNRQATPPLLLQSGEVALRAIEQVILSLKRQYQLVKVSFAQPQNTDILNVPKRQVFTRYLMDKQLLYSVPTHVVDGETVVDTKFEQEFRIG